MAARFFRFARAARIRFNQRQSNPIELAPHCRAQHSARDNLICPSSGGDKLAPPAAQRRNQTGDVSKRTRAKLTANTYVLLGLSQMGARPNKQPLNLVGGGAGGPVGAADELRSTSSRAKSKQTEAPTFAARARPPPGTGKPATGGGGGGARDDDGRDEFLGCCQSNARAQNLRKTRAPPQRALNAARARHDTLAGASANMPKQAFDGRKFAREAK